MNTPDWEKKLDELSLEADTLHGSYMTGRLMQKWGSVYLLQCQGLYKIGRAGNPQARLNALAIANPYPIDLVFSVEVPDAPRMELLLHHYFREKRVRGEWFELNLDDVDMLNMLFAKEFNYG